MPRMDNIPNYSIVNPYSRNTDRGAAAVSPARNELLRVLQEDVVDIRRNIDVNNRIISNNEKIISNNEKIIDLTEQQIATTEKIIGNNEKIISNIEKIISNNEKIIDLTEQQIATTEKIIGNNEKIISNIEQQIANTEQEIVIMEKMIPLMEGIIAAGERMIEIKQAEQAIKDVTPILLQEVVSANDPSKDYTTDKPANSARGQRSYSYLDQSIQRSELKHGKAFKQTATISPSKDKELKKIINVNEVKKLETESEEISLIQMFKMESRKMEMKSLDRMLSFLRR